ncbi:MAG TPA: cupredoxin domain-containing protein [Actinomycetota bacterium]|nr:cupredoxin domain-containing protein [Actinomycetota bacterium]
MKRMCALVLLLMTATIVPAGAHGGDDDGAPPPAGSIVVRAPYASSATSHSEQSDGTPLTSATSDSEADASEGTLQVRASAASNAPPLDTTFKGASAAGTARLRLPAVSLGAGIVRITAAFEGSGGASRSVVASSGSTAALQISMANAVARVASVSSSGGALMDEQSGSDEGFVVETTYVVTPDGTCPDAPVSVSLDVLIEASARATGIASAVADADLELEWVAFEPDTCGGPITSSDVSVLDNDFSPVELTVPARTTVTWTWNGDAPHSVTAENAAFDSGVLTGRENTFAFLFTGPGRYPYYCDLHGKPGGDGMAGTIIVT